MKKSITNLQKCDIRNPFTARITRMGRFYCAPDWSWDSMGSSVWSDRGTSQPLLWNFDLWTVLQGKGHLRTQNRSFDLRMGDCFILRGDHPCSARVDPNDPLQVIAVHFDYISPAGDLFFPKEIELHRRLTHMEFFIHLLERLESSWAVHQQTQNAESNTWLSACLAEIESQDRISSLYGLPRQQSTQIETICAAIRREPEKPWNVEDMAQEMNCSRAHFSRLFKQFTGMSTRDFISNTRIEAAKSMLYSSNYTVGQIAELLGYQDIYYFSRHFKEKTGRSPSAFRFREC